ncbi:DUF441 domain-containing protein [Calditerricola yamamurae]
MASVDATSLLLLALAVLGIVSHNAPVSIAVLLLLLFRLAHLDRLLPFFEQHGLNLGILVLTMGIMAPLASGKISPGALVRAFTTPASLLAVAVGVFVSYLAGKGVPLMAQNPVVVTGILVGTILGVALFRGVPTGPLIAAGILAVLLGLGRKLG